MANGEWRMTLTPALSQGAREILALTGAPGEEGAGLETGGPGEEMAGLDTGASIRRGKPGFPPARE
jgi:hypothetical protein